MAKKEKDFDETHRRNLNTIQTKIDRIFAKAAEEAALIGVNIDAVLPDDKIFSFDDYPKTKKMIDELLYELNDSIEVTIVNGVRQGWNLSNGKNDALANRVFGKNVHTLTTAQKQRYFNNNASALDAFIARKTNGLNLSDRVWRYSNQFKSEIEMGLDLGIRSGQSAASMTRSLRDYLKHPDKLFRRVRDKHGLLRLSQAAEDFHPGRGVYRSSYKNARRLAATETNIAYRTADYLRWQQMDFVVGIEVLLSNNHTVKLQPGETTDDPTQLRKDGTPKANAVRPLHDICDELQGRYPKDFKFTGWHPQCRCYAVSILKTPEEMADDAERIARGEQPSTESVNTVHNTPEAFDKWVRDHADKIKTSKSVPYFIRDNQQRVNRLLEEDNRTPKHGAVKHGRSSDKKFYEIKNDKILGKAAKLNKDTEKDAKEICQELGIKHKPMTLAEADNGAPNICGDNNNCQSCVVVYEARRRGINLTALKYKEISNDIALNLGYNSGIAFVDSKGNTPKVHEIRGTDEEMVRQLKKAIENKGRYHVGRNENNYGHIIVAERLDDKTLILYDPQTNDTYTIEDFVKKSDYIEYLRVDKLRFNRKVLSAISRIIL